MSENTSIFTILLGEREYTVNITKCQGCELKYNYVLVFVYIIEFNSNIQQGRHLYVSKAFSFCLYIQGKVFAEMNSACFQ